MFLISSGLTQLNSSLQDIDLRYTSANGAEWSERGADTWHPFSGAFQSVICIFGSLQAWASNGITVHILNADGTYYTKHDSPQNVATFITENSDIVSAQVTRSSGSNYVIGFTTKKAGYYFAIGSTWTSETENGAVQYPIGDTSFECHTSIYGSGGRTDFYLSYCGDKNPFE